MDRGISPEEMGEVCGVSGRTIRRVEEGRRPTDRNAYLIAQFFDRSPSELFEVAAA